jgi:hypothetical protein
VRIDTFKGVVQPSNWLELRENRRARANPSLVAA